MTYIFQPQTQIDLGTTWQKQEVREFSASDLFTFDSLSATVTGEELFWGTYEAIFPGNIFLRRQAQFLPISLIINSIYLKMDGLNRQQDDIHSTLQTVLIEQLLCTK